MKLNPVFSDTTYPDAARAYASCEMAQSAWDRLNKSPLFQVWLRDVLAHHFAHACEPVVEDGA